MTWICLASWRLKFIVRYEQIVTKYTINMKPGWTLLNFKWYEVIILYTSGKGNKVLRWIYKNYFIYYLYMNFYISYFISHMLWMIGAGGHANCASPGPPSWSTDHVPAFPSAASWPPEYRILTLCLLISQFWSNLFGTWSFIGFGALSLRINHGNVELCCNISLVIFLMLKPPPIVSLFGGLWNDFHRPGLQSCFVVRGLVSPISWLVVW